MPREKNKDSLLNLLDSAFEDVPIPDKETITECECKHCQILRDDFWQQSNSDHSTIIEANYSDLPLFSPDAFQYFVNKYIRYSIENPDSDVCQHTIFTLTPFEDKSGKQFWEKRLNVLTTQQIESFIYFLELIVDEFTDPRDSQSYKEDLDRGLKFWKKNLE